MRFWLGCMSAENVVCAGVVRTAAKTLLSDVLSNLIIIIIIMMIIRIIILMIIRRTPGAGRV